MSMETNRATYNVGLMVSNLGHNLKKIGWVAGSVAMLLFAMMLALRPMEAQTGGAAGIQGTVVDATGASIPHATVSAMNDATHVVTTRETTGNGLFTMSPIPPGVYTVTVSAPGFSKHVQQNFSIDALVLTALDVKMEVGQQDTSVTVTEAPPALETTNATLGLTIDNENYANLPLQMNNAQRDPTAFGALAPGSQGGTRLPVIGGTGNFLGQLYLDGLPAETVNQQGDNRVASQSLSVDAVDSIQVVTSTPPAEYSGAGAENLTMKSGGAAYHGQVSDFVRNTIFDAWGFLQKAPVKLADGTIAQLPKSVDHQNEFSASLGGHAPFTNNKVFFFGAYDRYHSRRASNPASSTLPTVLEKRGDFTELSAACATTAGCIGGGGLSGTGANNPAFLFDPTSTSCVGTVCTRKPFQGLKNGVPTNNVIPAGYLSPIALALEKGLPDPSIATQLVNNYTQTTPSGFDNHSIDYRVDYDLSAKHRLSTVGAMGTVNYLNNYGTPNLPLPYVGGTIANIFPQFFDIEERWTISNSMVNQFKYGFVQFRQPQINATDKTGGYGPATFGITNLPGGQASSEFPGATFATTPAFSNGFSQWTANSGGAVTQAVTPNTYTLLDNLQYVKGRHAITAGITVEWEQINTAAPVGLTGSLTLPYTAYSTAPFTTGSNALFIGTAGVPAGNSYASFLLGAVGGSPGLQLQQGVNETGGRYRPVAPYLEDTWKVSSKVTVDAGLRWDYLPPFHEVKDRWSYFNPTLTNAATGTLGALEFAGSQGGSGISCGCRTPVQTYWQNFGPRLGITFSPDAKTVFRAGIGHVFSQAGGVGGRGGNSGGTGQTGFNVSAIAGAETKSGAGAAPSFYLNNGAAFTAAGLANTSLFGPNFNYPSAPPISAASQILSAGNYLNAAGQYVTAAGVSYADPYFSGRAPDFTFFNFGLQRAVTSNLTLAINYVGNQSHHLQNATNGGTGGARGYWSNQLDPKYVAALYNVTDSTGKLPILTAPATAVNVAKASSVMSGISIPAYFQAAAAVNGGTATIAQGLTPFPQYIGINDLWGANVGNFSYHSLQVTLEQRQSHGLTFNANYTWSKNIGDDGTFRSGYDIPAGAVSGGGTQNYHQDRIDRGLTTVSGKHVVHAYGVYQIPLGKGHRLGGNFVERALFSGYQVSGIYTYSSGSPIGINYGGCTTPGLGQCMPDVNPNFSGDPRIGGSYGSGPVGRSSCNLIQSATCTTPLSRYINAAAFSAPTTSTTGTKTVLNLIGNAPRTGAFGLVNPASQNLDMSVRRNIQIREKMGLVIEVDCLNTLNHTIFGGPNATFGSATFGAVTGVSNQPRDFQLAGHFNF
jgi:hypothetical protein